MLGLLSALAVLDLWTTLVAVDVGAKESNPAFKSQANDVFYLPQALVCRACAVWLGWEFYWVGIAVAITTTIAIVWNLAIIRFLQRCKSLSGGV
jgi:hypothetical protein